MEIRYELHYDVESQEMLGKRADGTIRCINSAFGHQMPADEIQDAIRGKLVVLALLEDETIVGFSTLHRRRCGDYPQLHSHGAETPAWYLGAATIDKDFQGRGMYSELMRYRIEMLLQEKAGIVFTYTQNPRVEKGHRAAFDACVASGRLLQYDVQRHLLPKFYGRRLTHDPLESAGTPYETLDAEAGDAFMLQYELEHAGT